MLLTNFSVFILFVAYCVETALVLDKETQPKAAITLQVQATNNTQAPSTIYIVDAIQCLEEAYSVYDNDQDRAAVYAELFQEKHNGTWNVAVGYTTIYTHSEIYIEAIVSGGGASKKDDDVTSVLYEIFSVD